MTRPCQLSNSPRGKNLTHDLIHWKPDDCSRVVHAGLRHNESEFIVYRLLVARSRLLWGDGDAVHCFYQFSGLVVAILGALWAMGII